MESLCSIPALPLLRDELSFQTGCHSLRSHALSQSGPIAAVHDLRSCIVAPLDGPGQFDALVCQLHSGRLCPFDKPLLPSHFTSVQHKRTGGVVTCPLPGRRQREPGRVFRRDHRGGAGWAHQDGALQGHLPQNRGKFQAFLHRRTPASGMSCCNYSNPRPSLTGVVSSQPVWRWWQ